MNVYQEFDFGVDMFDSRDVLERINFLERGDEDSLDEDEKAELSDLNEVLKEFDFVTFRDGMTFIRDDYFKAYAQDYAEDIGAIDHSGDWPSYCIDWDYAVRELQMDFYPIEIRGIEYWAR